MDVEKFAEKTILVRDSNDDSGAPSRKPPDEIANEQLADGQSKQTRSLINESESIAEIGLNRFPDVKLPDIKIPERQRADHTRSKAPGKRLALQAKSPRHVLPIIVLLLAAGILALGANVLAERSRTETAYRNFVDQAQLAQINQDPNKAAVCWRAAIERATKLGDGHKELGDMYLQLAKADCRIAFGVPIDYSSNPKRAQLLKQDLQKAIKQYRITPNSTLPQIEAQLQLLEAMPVWVINTDFDDFDLLKLKTARRLASALRKQGKIAEAAKEYIECMRHGHLRALYGARDEVLWREIESFVTDLKPGDHNANDALALAYAVVYFTQSQNTNDGFKSMSEGIALLAKALKNSGHHLFDYLSTKSLADQMFNKGDYSAASVGYWRCQGMKDSAAVRERLRQCFLRIHPVPSTAMSEILPILDELKRLHTSAFGADSRQVTSILEYYGNAYLKTGDFENAVKTRREILNRKLADTNTEPDYDPRQPITSSNVVSKAYESLIGVYILEGKFTEARSIYQEIPKTVMLNDIGGDLDNQYVETCSRAGWLYDAKIYKSLQLNR